MMTDADHRGLAGLGGLTFGTSDLGRGTRPGSVEDDAAIETALAMLRSDAYVDTSNMYAGGRSEEVLGAALAELARAERASAADRIITKVDRDASSGALDADQVRRSLEQSLTRLGLDRVRWLHLHDPYVIPFAEARSPGGVIDEMVRIRDEGTADAIGIATGRTPIVEQYIGTGAFDMVLSHNRFTIVDRSATTAFEQARSRGMTTFNAAPFGGNLLAKGSAHGSAYAYQPVSARLRAWTADVERLCAECGIPLAAAALQFSLRSDLVDSTVVSASAPARIGQLCELAQTPVPDGFWPALAALPAAPTPIDDTEEAR